MALTKSGLADYLFQNLGISKREAREIIDAFFDEIIDSLERGDNVKLSGFGNFKIRDKKARPGRNPKTGKEVEISARRVVTFRAGQKLKAKVEKYAGPEHEKDISGEED